MVFIGQKLSNKPFLMNGDPGTWNCCESGHPHLFKTRKGKTYLFYQGNDDFLVKLGFFQNMEVKWKNRHPFIAHYINQKHIKYEENISFLYTLLVFFRVYAQENKVKVELVNGDKISLFSLKKKSVYWIVILKHIMDLNHAYMLSLEPDRLLSWFRREVGLTPKHNPILLGI